MNLSFNQKRHDRFGFTMVELLLVISIIAVMSSMALVVMKNAQEEAKEAATIARVDQIESLLQLQIEDYEVRRLPISINELRAYVNANPIPAVKPLVQLRNLKRRILADMINAEMPRPILRIDPMAPPPPPYIYLFDNNPDLGVFPTQQYPVGAASPRDQGFGSWLDGNYPGLRARLRSVAPASVTAFARYNSTLYPPPPTQRGEMNLPGEYLYAILARIDIDGTSAIEQLGNSAFGNADEDDFPEVVDAWGEQMSLQIWQVDAVEGSPDVWEDVPRSANNETYVELVLNGEPVKVWNPVDFVLMSPVIPREVSKFRFKVASFGLSNRIH